MPGTHKRWDNDRELDVRLEQNGCKNHDELATGLSVTLNAGDMLIFDANMIHRGIYGMNRLTLDVLFCDPSPVLVKFVNEQCLPNEKMLVKLENPQAFTQAIKIKETLVTLTN
ncbi:phytanoyl-CoA dioxygenase family protein [Veronia nyctiphanis]|uniref:hypothetical protein n=1 Tax=Veronia nyctiphanis TaxID=1278244 RepID=UPI00191BDF38|nr:hypothetical protein [Veronia nyctiphanis]